MGMSGRKSNRGSSPLSSSFGAPVLEQSKKQQLAIEDERLRNWPTRVEWTTICRRLSAGHCLDSLAVGRPFGEVPEKNSSAGMVYFKTGNETKTVHAFDRKHLKKL